MAKRGPIITRCHDCYQVSTCDKIRWFSQGIPDTCPLEDETEALKVRIRLLEGERAMLKDSGYNLAMRLLQSEYYHEVKFDVDYILAVHKEAERG